MSLLQISDPTITNENLKKFVVGIDLGTTNSLIASYDSNLKIYQENCSFHHSSYFTYKEKFSIIIQFFLIFICLRFMKIYFMISLT